MPVMPNCIGVEYEEALQLMVNAGVRVLPLGYFQTDPVTITWIQSTQLPGVVTAQSPISGATVSANSDVQLTCAQFPVSVCYPGGNN